MSPQVAIQETINDFLTETKKGRETVEEVEETVSAPVDNYQATQNPMREKLAPRPRGADARLGVDLSILEQGNLAFAFKKAQDEAEAAEREGDHERARLTREAYMQNTLLPTIDALVGMNSAAALLANQEALDTLDRYAFVEGGGGRGYTSALINSLYDTTALPSNSDAYVQFYLSELKSLFGEGQIRAGIGLANQLKDSIDRGEHIASPEDYELIQRAVFKSY